MQRFSLLILLLSLPLIVGCDGCRKSDDNPSDNEEEGPVEDFSSKNAEAFPNDQMSSVGYVKPGHWVTASQSLKSNKADARGRLQTQVTTKSSSKNEILSVRPIVLPKGQMKRFDYRTLAPAKLGNDDKTTIFNSRFVSQGRTVFYDTRQPFSVLSGEEYFFVILTKRPQRFAKFQVADWSRPWRDTDIEFKTPASNYRFIFPDVDELLTLSETMLDWSSTAVLFWDDVPPETLTPNQLQAVADWVRFGGLLIVNGAVASDAVAQTVLTDILPLEPNSNIELNSDAAVELLQQWSVDPDESTEKQIASLQGQSSRVAVDGFKSDDAEPVPGTGSLVLARQVGLGRVIQPRFDLTSAWISNWDSYQSFFNGVILNRPRRQFGETRDSGDIGILRQRYADYPTMHVADPAINTKFRVSARDAILRTEKNQSKDSVSGSQSQIDPLVYADGKAGIGGWSNESDVMELFRDVLQEESGIEIPGSSLVLKTLGYYLLILVPINYIVFRLMGRLEYAWLAVPVIALGGAVWVARTARLDIGFARKKTELAIVELQPDYQRAHLSRLIAIYNSLSSTYDVEFETIDGVALPLQRVEENLPEFQTFSGDGPVLSGLAIQSNKTRLLHTEQMIDMGGAISIDATGKLSNQTGYELYDAFVIDKTDPANLQIAAVGACPPGSVVSLRYSSQSTPSITDELPMQTAYVLQRLAAGPAIPDGSIRLVGRIDASLPGMTISPEASQSVSQTVVLAHLKHAPIAAPQKDVNLVSAFRDEKNWREDEELNQDGTPVDSNL